MQEVVEVQKSDQVCQVKTFARKHFCHLCERQNGPLLLGPLLAVECVMEREKDQRGSGAAASSAAVRMRAGGAPPTK